MRPDEVKHVADSIRRLKGIRVHGFKESGKFPGDKMLVFSFQEREHHVSQYEQAVGKIAKLTGAHGHQFESLGICSLCYGALKGPDGHYHSIRSSFGPGAAEGCCCQCLEERGGTCTLKRIEARKGQVEQFKLLDAFKKGTRASFRKLLKTNKAGAKRYVVEWIKAGSDGRSRVRPILDPGFVEDLDALAKKLVARRRASKT